MPSRVKIFPHLLERLCGLENLDFWLVTSHCVLLSPCFIFTIRSDLLFLLIALLDLAKVELWQTWPTGHFYMNALKCKVACRIYRGIRTCFEVGYNGI